MVQAQIFVTRVGWSTLPSDAEPTFDRFNRRRTFSSTVEGPSPDSVTVPEIVPVIGTILVIQATPRKGVGVDNWPILRNLREIFVGVNGGAVVLKATVKKWPDFEDFQSPIGYTKRLYFRGFSQPESPKSGQNLRVQARFGVRPYNRSLISRL